MSASFAERHSTAAIVVPPRSSAVPSKTAETTQRDQHLQLIAEYGRMARQWPSGDATCQSRGQHRQDQARD